MFDFGTFKTSVKSNVQFLTEITLYCVIRFFCRLVNYIDWEKRLSQLFAKLDANEIKSVKFFNDKAQ